MGGKEDVLCVCLCLIQRTAKKGKGKQYGKSRKQEKEKENPPSRAKNTKYKRGGAKKVKRMKDPLSKGSMS